MFLCTVFNVKQKNLFMEKENVTWRLVAIYKGKDGYGYGTTQKKTVKKEFKDKGLMLKNMKRMIIISKRGIQLEGF